MESLFAFVGPPPPAVLGGDSSNMDSRGDSTLRVRPEAAVRTESNIVSLLKSVSSSSAADKKSRTSKSELVNVDTRSWLDACVCCETGEIGDGAPTDMAAN